MLTYYMLLLCASLHCPCVSTVQPVADLLATKGSLVYTTALLQWSETKFERCDISLDVEQKKVGDLPPQCDAPL
jgi:hypothetical protein